MSILIIKTKTRTWRDWVLC